MQRAVARQRLPSRLFMQRQQKLAAVRHSYLEASDDRFELFTGLLGKGAADVAVQLLRATNITTLGYMRTRRH